VNVSAKYLTLFVAAMLSVILQFAISSLLNFRGHDSSTLLGANCMMIPRCFYLQSEFASKHYAEHCRKIDVVCRWVLWWKLAKHDEATEAHRKKICRGNESMRPSAYVPSITTVDSK